MARLRMHNFTISLDGYAAGPDQRPEEPLGEGGRRLHEWISCTVRLWVPAAFCGRRRSRRPPRGDNCACPASPHASCGGLGLNAATAGVVFVDLADRGGLADPDGIAAKIDKRAGAERCVEVYDDLVSVAGQDANSSVRPTCRPADPRAAPVPRPSARTASSGHPDRRPPRGF